jgi:hypothetical protein
MKRLVLRAEDMIETIAKAGIAVGVDSILLKPF